LSSTKININLQLQNEEVKIMSADQLTINSRQFLERTKTKVLISLVTFGFALCVLGWASCSGGVSNFYGIKADQSGLSNDFQKGYQAQQAGYGI
jgi:hypothetical protein